MKSLLAVILLAPTALAQGPVEIRIDAAAPRISVSPNLYGIFFEEINHSGEGGIYAEMVLNRDFEIGNLPQGARWAGNLLRTKDDWQERKWFGNALHGWKLTAEGGAHGSLKLETENPLNANNPHSMRVTVKHAGTRAGVVNSGFFGMNLVAGETYELSFYLRTENREHLNIKAQLESASGHEVYASATVTDAGGEWRRYQCTLRPTLSDPNGRLTLLIDRPQTLWLDVVSLFPHATYRNRPNGLRQDLVEALAQMRPAFLRFPGGAVVGGLNLDNRFQWRNSIGDIAARKGTMNLWGYYSTNGLGFHEYLQLAEDLGANALYVCNPGFSDNYRHAEFAKPEDVPAFVQEALDAIEYAVGPVSSKWGAERAKNGHAAPFRLRYVEIGNEATGKAYLENYKVFFEAIHARYPDLILVSNLRQAEPRAPLIDDHMYGSPEKFFAEHARYDRADRSGPQVYIGEYASNSGVGEGNLMAALSEAVYMIGLERNSDVVKMASYAPLFFNVNDIAWPVNLIGFDSSRVVLRSSYHVQKLFAVNRPDEVLRTTLNPAPRGDAGSVYALAGFHKGTGDVVLKAVNASGLARAVNVELAGLRVLPQQARVITLAHADAAAENTIDEPVLIVPAESRAQITGPQFSYTLPPYSVTVMRLSPR